MRIDVTPAGVIQADGQQIGQVSATHGDERGPWMAVVGSPRRYCYAENPARAASGAARQLAAFWRSFLKAAA